MPRKRAPRKRVTLGRSFQLVKEGRPLADNSGWTAEILGSMFLGVWWWIVGAPEDVSPPGESNSETP